MEHADTSGIMEQLEQLNPAIRALEAANTEEELREFLEMPGASDVAGHILGISARWLAGRNRSQVARHPPQTLGAEGSLTMNSRMR